MQKQILLMAFYMSAAVVTAQGDWAIDGNSGLDEFDNYIGNNDNNSLNFRTDSIQRMKLYRNQTSTINGFSLIDQTGFWGISARTGFFNNATGIFGHNAVGPFSRLHLVDGVGQDQPITYAQQFGYRPWQRNGITFTGNGDQGYIGQKYNINDYTDMVIQWSDNPVDKPWGTDRLRFIFTNAYSDAAYGAGSEEGLESFQVYVPNDTSTFVGIGDWYRASVLNGGISVDPDERLDVLDRTIRIRKLIPDYNNDTLTRVVMVDSTGRLHWRRIDSWPSDPGGGTGDCEWTLGGGLNGNFKPPQGLLKGTLRHS